MRVYRQYLIILAVLMGLANVILTLLAQTDLAVYFIVNFVLFLVVTLPFTRLNPRAGKALNTVSLTVFAGFLVILFIKVYEVIGP